MWFKPECKGLLNMNLSVLLCTTLCVRACVWVVCVCVCVCVCECAWEWSSTHTTDTCHGCHETSIASWSLRRPTKFTWSESLWFGCVRVLVKAEVSIPCAQHHKTVVHKVWAVGGRGRVQPGTVFEWNGWDFWQQIWPMGRRCEDPRSIASFHWLLSESPWPWPRCTR